MYLIILTLLGTSLALAIGFTVQELQRLSSKLEIEKAKHLSSLKLQANSSSVVDFQRAQFSRSDHWDSKSSSALPKLTRLIKTGHRQISRLNTFAELSDKGLAYCLNKMVHRRSTSALQLDFETDVTDRFPQYVELYLYQACSELIQNTMKHSNATNCHIQLYNIYGAVRLTVSDNGKNEYTGQDPQPGFGLTSLKRRCDKHGGQLIFRLNAHGAETAISIPLVSAPLMVRV